MGIAAAVVGAGVVGAAASVYSGAEQSAAASKAADVSLQEANSSNALTKATYESNKALLTPYVDAGTSALTKLNSTAGTANFTGSDLVNTPGYQFSLQQGLLATQAGSSAQGQGTAVSGAGSSQGSGIGASGPMGKALANYAEGLASTTYQQQYQNYLTQNQQNYNQLAGLVSPGEQAGAAIAGVGQSAATTTAGTNATAASQYGSATTSGAAATAAGTTGAANSLSNSALLSALLQGSTSTSGTTSGVSNYTAYSP